MATRSQEILNDERFRRVMKDPRFWEMPEKERKIKIDKRFQGMFHDKRFKLNYTVDKRGRPVNHSSSEDLKRYYDLDSEDSDLGESEDVKERQKRKGKKLKQKESSASREGEGDGDGVGSSWPEEEPSGSQRQEEQEEISDSEDDEELSEEELSDEDTDSDSGPDLARGKGNIETSSDDDDDFDDPLQKEPEIEHKWGELAGDALHGETITHRLAVCNMDWDKIKAKDLLAVFNSFLPQGGAVFSVKIYPSEFGKGMMKEEEMHGPAELLDDNLPEDSDEDTEDQRIVREKVREYQFKRLRYYYAVVDCDSPETANKLYEGCDGMEFESSCSFLDLRFIPDELTFGDEPKDVAADVDLASYKPKYFSTAALSASKVELTWDITDYERVSTLTKQFKTDEIEEMDFKAYLASSSEEDDEADVEDAKESEQEGDSQSMAESKGTTKAKKNVEDQISKYRELLKNIQGKEEKNEDMEIEITWVPGLKETTEAIVKKKLEAANNLTPWEKYLEKRKEKRQKRRRKNRAEQQQAKNAEGLSDDEIPSDVDLNDPFFTDELKQSELQHMKTQKKIKKPVDKPLTPEEEDELEKEKAKMALLLMDDEAEDRKHFNYDKIVEHQNLSKSKKKKLMKKKLLEEDNFKVDVADPRFQALYTSHHFNLDPTDPNFKKTNATQSILEEKSRQRQQQQRQAATLQRKESEVTGEEATKATKKPVDDTLSLLVKSIKAKTEQFQARKKQKTA